MANVIKDIILTCKINSNRGGINISGQPRTWSCEYTPLAGDDSRMKAEFNLVFILDAGGHVIPIETPAKAKGETNA